MCSCDEEKRRREEEKRREGRYTTYSFTI